MGESFQPQSTKQPQGLKARVLHQQLSVLADTQIKAKPESDTFRASIMVFFPISTTYSTKHAQSIYILLNS